MFAGLTGCAIGAHVIFIHMNLISWKAEQNRFIWFRIKGFLELAHSCNDWYVLSCLVIKYWYSWSLSIVTVKGKTRLKQEELISNTYHYSWENIHIPHWDWKSDNPFCGGSQALSGITHCRSISMNTETSQITDFEQTTRRWPKLWED